MPWKAVLALGVVGAIYASMANDPRRDEAEACLRSDERVRHQVGQVRSASLHRVAVSGDSAPGAPYREYSFRVEGERGRTYVVVRGSQAGPSKAYRYAIERIE